MKPSLSRPSVLAGSVTGLLLLAALWAADPTTQDGRRAPVAFFLIGDTHLLADKEEPAKLDPRSAALTRRLADALNRLPGTAIPQEAGSGTVLSVRGVIHAGDCIDTGGGTKKNKPMEQTEWTAFVDVFGLTGRDGRLRMPIYEVHGNHDSTREEGFVLGKIIERNRRRPGVTNVSKNGLHYSWDWGDVHFVNLGLIVGQVEGVNRRRRYASVGSLDFLIADLKDKVGTSGRPVVITHHVDMLRYAQPLPIEDKMAEKMEWDPADVRAFYEALSGYNVAAILYGHTHARNVFRWDGSAKAAPRGIPVFNVAKSSHFSSLKQAFFYLEIAGPNVTAREYQTEDGWESGSWTPQVWTAAVAGVNQ
jgi:predicted phosphodiesterase